MLYIGTQRLLKLRDLNEEDPTEIEASKYEFSIYKIRW